jgi:hypothetical protein
MSRAPPVVGQLSMTLTLNLSPASLKDRPQQAVFRSGYVGVWEEQEARED